MDQGKPWHTSLLGKQGGPVSTVFFFIRIYSILFDVIVFHFFLGFQRAAENSLWRRGK